MQIACAVHSLVLWIFQNENGCKLKTACCFVFVIFCCCCCCSKLCLHLENNRRIRIAPVITKGKIKMLELPFFSKITPSYATFTKLPPQFFETVDAELADQFSNNFDKHTHMYICRYIELKSRFFKNIAVRSGYRSSVFYYFSQ